MDAVEAPLGRREKRKQEIRARIEDAAYTLFKRQGIDETSIEQICQEADVARRTFYGYFPNKHALLGGLGVSRIYSRMAPMLQELVSNHHTTRGRLEAMIDYIESNFATYEDIDRTLILQAPSALNRSPEEQKALGDSSISGFAELIRMGKEMGDVKDDYSPEILATIVVGTLNTLTTSWAFDARYPVFAKLEEARLIFEQLICKDLG
ncbi:MAG: TetR/AcrR family transcriptional regulator [Pseudomonadota bacterium]